MRILGALFSRNHALFAAGLWLGLSALPLMGQSALYVTQGSTAMLVRAAKGGIPLVEKGGKLIGVPTSRFSLQKIDEYAPVFVAIRDVEVRTSSRGYAMRSGDRINREFTFRGEFESGYRLDHVFLALEMHMKEAGEALFIREVGDLVPNEPRGVSVTVPVELDIGPGNYHLHLFTYGREVLHSEIPFDVREQILDGMIARRIRNVSDAPPKPFVGPAPEYPKALFKTKIGGTTVVSMRIAPNGSVLDPVIKSTSDPAFGPPVIEAIRAWRFLPRVQGGFPVETTVEMPFSFVAGG